MRSYRLHKAVMASAGVPVVVWVTGYPLTNDSVRADTRSGARHHGGRLPRGDWLRARLTRPCPRSVAGVFSRLP
jgi:hypothetical protein